MKAISVTQFAKHFRISRTAVIRSLKIGKFKATMVGHTWAINESELQNWTVMRFETKGKRQHNRLIRIHPA